MLDEKLVRQWKRIYSPVYALSFHCDAFYDALRAKVEDDYPENFIDIGNDLTLDCQAATDLLKDSKDHSEKLMHEFMDH